MTLKYFLNLFIAHFTKGANFLLFYVVKFDILSI